MNREEFDIVTSTVSVVPYVSAADMGMLPEHERTLLYGYTCERRSWHVYIKDGFIHLLVLDGTHSEIRHEKKKYDWHIPDLVPDKRAYAESTDFNFALLCRDRSVDIPFTQFDEVRYEQVKDLQFHAPTYEEFE